MISLWPHCGGGECTDGAFGTLQAAHATTKITVDYEAVWSAWERASPTGESPARAAAAEKMRDCLNNNRPELDLQCVGLTSLPDNLPPDITALKISHSALSRLPALPEGLQTLDVSSNRLTRLPVLPAGLRTLDVGINRLTRLPALPAGLRTLNVYNNRLTRLPELPAELRMLDANDNRLTRLPVLPAGLQALYASSNLLTDLPTLSAGLQVLHASRNRLISLPEGFAALSRDASVILEGNPLSERTHQAQRNLTSAPSYLGPRIHFSMAVPSAPQAARSLDQAIADWLAPAKEGDTNPTDKWRAFGREDDAASFSSFLDRLRNTKNFRKDPGFKIQIASWLTQLAGDDKLREKTFAIATEATSSCEDRVTLALNQMKNILLVHNAEKGEYDNNLPELVSVGREMFRLEKLEKIARGKVDTLYFVDEIEVYLGYQNKLKEALRLTSVTTEMCYFGVSDITESDLQAAEMQVKTAENSEFMAWIQQWMPLRSVLDRKYPESLEALREKKISDYDYTYRELTETELKSVGLVGDTDAECIIGARALESAEKAFLAGLRPLVDKMLDGYLETQWP